VNLIRPLAILALAVVGAFFFFASGLGYSSGFPSESLLLSFIGSLSIFSLLGAAVIGLMSFRMPAGDSPASQMALATVYLGLFLAFAAPFIPFPTGCNLDAWPYNLTNVFHGCPASPEGVWSTIWPNALTTCVGVLLVTTGYGRLRSRKAVLPGLGMGLIVSGFALLVWGLSIGYFTSCPAGGCPPLTGSEWWSLFWPDVVADILGVVCMAAGSVILIASWRLNPIRPSSIVLDASSSARADSQA
jgi:hypothetical protein